jgi:hypothetical protein|tara:strand:- start:48 stop:218 length:171 start_codon:yes stop_codon:yes gene_type:complete
MKATKSEMKKFTTDELIDYVERTNAKYDKAPPFIRRISYIGWANNRSALIREIRSR